MNNKTYPRNPVVAFLLSFFVLGLGQVYNGQSVKTAVTYAGLFLFALVTAVLRVRTSFWGLVFFVAVVLALQLFLLADAVLQARKLKYYVPPRNNGLRYAAAIVGLIVVAWLSGLVTRTVGGTQAFSAPSESNSPSIMPGDLVIADFKAYKSKEIAYGDMVIFENETKEMWLFRVVGLPGDKVQLTGDSLLINGRLVPSRFIAGTEMYGEPFEEYAEELPNGFRHNVYKYKKIVIEAEPETVTVPANSYFLMGDNRDNAMDSRYIGCIGRDAIRGQVLYCYWSDECSRIGADFRKNE